MGLDFLSGKRPAQRRVLLYGVQGVGKSTFGAMAPKSIFLPTEDGLADIECDSLPLCTSFAAVKTSLESVKCEPHDFKTLVVDSLDWLEILIFEQVAKKNSVKSIEEIGYGKGYLFALDLWRDFLASLSALRAERSMEIILISHAKIETFKNPEGEDFDRYQPRLHKAASALVQEWCDEVLFATYKTYVKTAPQGFGKAQAKGLGSGERVLKTEERPSHMAKNRLGLPPEIPFAYIEYANFFRG